MSKNMSLKILLLYYYILQNFIFVYWSMLIITITITIRVYLVFTRDITPCICKVTQDKIRNIGFDLGKN